MEKTANTQYEINLFLKKRWSPRAFDSKPIEKGKLKKIFEAARWTPSAMNDQPWRFIIGFKDDNTYKKILDSLVEFNQAWTKFAPVMVVACGKKTYQKNNENNPTFKYDVGQAVANMTLQATEENLYIHQMSGFSQQIIIDQFNIPDDFEPITVFTIGYYGNPKQLHPKIEKLEYNSRERKEISTFVFSEIFDKTIEL